jgi:hypothetical protein
MYVAREVCAFQTVSRCGNAEVIAEALAEFATFVRLCQLFVSDVLGA